MKRQSLLLFLFALSLCAVTAEARQKQPVTASKINRGLRDVLEDREKMTAERRRLETENKRLKVKSYASVSMMVINQTDGKVAVWANDGRKVHFDGKSVHVIELESEKALKPGDNVSVSVGGNAYKVKLDAGTQKAFAGGDVVVGVDFLSGSARWFLLVE